MKKVFSYVSIILAAAIIMTGCSRNSPKAVATTYLEAYYHLDFEAAKKVSTEETKNTLGMLQSFSANFYPDSMKKAAKAIKVNIKDVKEEGDKATVTYNTSVTPSDQTLHLVKQKGKWLVLWTKQDEMKDAGGSDTTSTEPEPTMGDSTTGGGQNPEPAPADTATAK
jgi:hypothetical protein